MRKFINYLMYLSLLSIPILFGMDHFYSQYKETEEFDSELAMTRLKQTSSKNYLEQHINTELQANNIDDAKMYLDVADLVEVNIDNTITSEYQDKVSFFNQSIRNTKDFAVGAVTGEVDSAAAMLGVVTSDFFVIGDIRDFSKESYNMLVEDDADEIIWGLSLIGIGLSVSTYYSAGATMEAKVGTSILKVARKTGAITAGLAADLSRLLRESLNMDKLKVLLKEVDLSSQKSIRTFSGQAFQNIKLDNIKGVLVDMSVIKESTSLLSAVHIVKQATKLSDIKLLSKVSTRFKGNTRGILKIIGKKGIKGAVKVTKYLTYALYALITTLLCWAYSLVSYLVMRKMRRMIK